MNKKEIAYRISEVIYDLRRGDHTVSCREASAITKLTVLVNDIADGEVNKVSFKTKVKLLKEALNNFTNVVRESAKWKSIS